MPRRLILLLAALTVFVLASAASALAGVGAQNGVRAFTTADQARAGLTSLESPCTRQDSTGSTARSVAGFCVATEDTTTLYRAVDEDEFNDAISSQEFRAGPNSMEGKWFAEQPSDALQWGQKFYGNEPFHVLQTDVPSGYADSLFSNPNLDGIGPARYADDLDTLNSVHGGISEYSP